MDCRLGSRKLLSFVTVDLVPSSLLFDPMSTAVVVCAFVLQWAYLASSPHDPWCGEEPFFSSHRRQSPLFNVVLVRHIRPVDVLSFQLRPHLILALSLFHGNTYEG